MAELIFILCSILISIGTLASIASVFLMGYEED